MDSKTVPNKPIETLRDSRLKASIWENESEKGRTTRSLLPRFTRTRTAISRRRNRFLPANCCVWPNSPAKPMAWSAT